MDNRLGVKREGWDYDTMTESPQCSDIEKDAWITCL
jgi:hypothetical protein